MGFEIDILDKFKGTLIGCAVGDALGAPVEGMTAMPYARCTARSPTSSTAGSVRVA